MQFLSNEEVQCEKNLFWDIFQKAYIQTYQFLSLFPVAPCKQKSWVNRAEVAMGWKFQFGVIFFVLRKP